MKALAQLFATGFLQVYFVAISTVCLAHHFLPGVVASSFLISLIWSFNVKRVAFGSMADRIVYSLGACCGSLGGLLTTDLFGL